MICSTGHFLASFNVEQKAPKGTLDNRYGCSSCSKTVAADLSREFMRLDKSYLFPNDILPSPATKVGDYAPRLMLRGKAEKFVSKTEVTKKRMDFVVGKKHKIISNNCKRIKN